MPSKRKNKSRQKVNKKDKFVALAIGLITFLFFLPGVFYGFINMDDLPLITGNRLVKSAGLTDLGDIFSYLAFTPYYKPLVYMTWIAERSIFGLSPQVLHLNNAILHSINAVLVFVLSRRLLPMMWKGLNPVMPAAALCALAWALHPFRIESVAWAVERKDVLFAFFYLLACISYLRFVKHGWKKYLPLAVLFYLMSILSKSMGITFLGAAILIELLYHGKRTFERPALIAKIPLVLTLIVGLYLLGFIFPPEIKMSQSRVVNAAKENVYVPEAVGGSGVLQFVSIANFRMVGFAAHTLVPVKIAIVYPREHWLNSLGSWVYVFLAVPLFFLALLYLKKDLRRTLGFGLVWFAVTISPILVSEGTGTNFLSDRYTYIPSLGIAWILIPWVIQLLPQKVRGGLTAGHLAAALVTIVLAVSTSINIRHWRSSLAVWENVIQKHPVNWYGYYNRAKLISAEDPEQAMADLNAAIEYLPNQGMLYFSRGTLKMDKGEHQSAIEDFDLALQYAPRDVQSWINRGSCNRTLKRYQEALNDFTTAYSFDTKFNSKALNNRALTLLDMNRLQPAIDDLTTIINSDPSYLNAYLNRANAYVRASRFAEAVQDYNQYLQSSPDDHGSTFRRGYAYASLGQHGKALEDFNRAIAIQPNQGFYYYGRAQSLAKLGRRQEAIQDYQAAQQRGVNVDPTEIEALR